MTRLHNKWILTVLVLVQPGCFLSGSRICEEDRSQPSPRILRPEDRAFSTNPLSNSQDRQESQEAKGKKEEGENGRKGEGEKKTQQDKDLPPLLLAPPPVIGELTSQSRSLTSPPTLNPAMVGPSNRTLVPGKLSALVASAPLDEPPAPPSTGLPPLENRFGSSGREPLEIAFSYLLADRQQEFLEQLKLYDPARQTLFERVLRTLPLLTHKKIADLNPAEASKICESYERVIGELRPHTRLVIDHACYCDWVNSFGDYQPCAEGHVFQASSTAQPGEGMQLGERVQLYAEVRNFASVVREGFYETRMASSVEIAEVKNGQKKTIWSHTFNEKRHRSRSPRNDHFNNYSFNVPPMPPGEYTLTIHIADETIPEARREESRSLPFRVGTRQ